MDFTRRQLLSAATTGGIVGVAGCSGRDAAGERSETPNTTGTASDAQTTLETATQAGTTEYRAWLPTPTALGIDDMYRVSGIRLSAIQEHKSHIRNSVYDFFKEGFRAIITPTGVAFGSLSWFLGYENAFIGRVTTSEQDVVKSLMTNGFQKESTNGEFTVYANSSGRHVAINGNTIVLNRRISPETWAGGVNAAVNTKQGATPRLVEQRASAKKLTDAFGDWTVLSLGLGGTGAAQLTGSTVLVEGDSSTITSVLVYESGSDIPRSKLEDQKAQYEQKEGVTDVEGLQINGRVAVLRLTAKTKSFASKTMKTLVS